MIYKDCHHLTFNMTTLHFIDTAILLKLPSLWVLTVLVLLHLQTVLQATTVHLIQPVNTATLVQQAHLITLPIQRWKVNVHLVLLAITVQVKVGYPSCCALPNMFLILIKSHFGRVDRTNNFTQIRVLQFRIYEAEIYYVQYIRCYFQIHVVFS